MEKYYKLEKINRQKFETEGKPMYFQTLAEAKKENACSHNNKSLWNLTKIKYKILVKLMLTVLKNYGKIK